MEKEKRNLKVVHDFELKDLLLSLGKLDKLQSGKLRCKFCRQVITLDNIHSIFPESGQVNFVCDHSDCVKKFLIYIQEKKL